MMKPPPFESSPHSPYPVGSVPRAGWFAVEPACQWAIPTEPLIEACPYPDTEYTAVLDEEGLSRIADNFDLAETDGRGMLLTVDHSVFATTPSTRAIGWVKALHAERGRLWGWIEWTENGHKEVNGGDWAFFSPEYDWKDFALVRDGVVTPTSLSGLSVTNNPNHKGQIPMVNMATNNHGILPNTTGRMPITSNTTHNHMKTPYRKAATSRQKNSEGADAPLPEDKKELPADTNSEEAPANKPEGNCLPEDEPQQNADDTGAMELLSDVCDELELAEDCNGDDVLSAIRNLKTQVEELTEALAEANSAAGTGAAGTTSQTNSRRYPHLFKSKQCNTALKGGKPNGVTTLQLGGRPVQVNCQEVQLVTHCQQAISKEESTLGRKLNPGEYSRVWQQAKDNYTSPHQ